MRIKTLCPHCDSPATARTSEQVTPTFKEIRYICTNPSCGFTFVVEHVIARGLSPSAAPRANVHIPFSKHTRKQHAVQLDLIT